MKLVRELDIFEDAELQSRIVWLSLALLLAGIAVIAMMLVAGVVIERISLLSVLATALATAVSFALHELVHAAFFWLMGGPGTRIRFGARDGMLFTEAPGLVLPTVRFAVVLIAPTVLVTCAIVAAGIALAAPLAAAVVATLHLSGCAGDLAIAQAMAETRPTHVEDAGNGVRLYV